MFGYFGLLAFIPISKYFPFEKTCVYTAVNRRPHCNAQCTSRESSCLEQSNY